MSQTKQINPSASIHCICEDLMCRVALNPILSSPIQTLLKTPHPRNDTSLYGFDPNCHNTVLHALGFRIGFFESSNELFYLLASPFCKKREGRPKAGDVIKLSEDHAYIAVSDQFAFNKSGPGNDLPYEIIRINDYFKKHGHDLSCQFLSAQEARDKQCKVTSSAYACTIPESLRSFDVLGSEARELSRRIDDCDYQNKVLGEKSETDVTVISFILGKMAEDALQVNQIKNLPPDLISAVRSLYLQSITEENRESMASSFDYNRDNFLVHFSLMAHPEMELSHLHPKQREAILMLRDAGIYSRLPAEERTAWGMIFLKRNGSWVSEDSPE